MEKKIFYDVVIELCNQMNKSINEIERELGYPRNALHNYKEGRIPSGIRLVELAQYFDVRPEYLLGISIQRPTKSIFQELNDIQKIEMYQYCQSWLVAEKLNTMNKITNNKLFK